MATFSDSGEAMDARSGGKIVRKRRGRVAKTPYDRPPAPQQPPTESPNWLTSVIFPATRRIASGAAKILSSVFDTTSSSSSSSSSTDNDFNCEDYSDNTDDAHYLSEDHGSPADATKCISKEPKKSEAKQAIEKLLMQETFSREECDRYIRIMNSRVVDSTRGNEPDAIVTETTDGTIDKATDDLCSKAVWEARKWLEEKKVGSSPLSDVADGSRGLNSFAATHIDKERGSPVDVAKSYMRSRPPWASASTENIELQTPSTMTSQFSRQGTLFSAADESLSSIKKRSSLVSGPWNIQEEIRRVRLKATEEMLHSLPSARIDLSSFVLSPKHGQDSSVTNLINSRGDEGNILNSVTETKPVEASTFADAKGSTNGGILALETNAIANEGLTSNPAILVSEQFQEPQTVKTAGESAASESCHSASPGLGIEYCADPRSTLLNGSPVEEMKEADGTHNANGLPTSQASLSSEVGTGEIHRQLEEESLNAVKQPEKESLNAVKSGAKTTHITENTCNLLSEASVEVPIEQETYSAAGFLQNSSSVHHDDLPRRLTQPNSNKLAIEADGTATKQEVKKPGRYNRRARVKGK